jgi:hypothetical protein
VPPSIYSVLEIAEASARRAVERPLSYVALTGAQDAFDRLDCPTAAWVDGNAVGKSFELAYLVHRFIRGEHPTMRKRGIGPARVLVMGYSYEQMIPLMEKLWMLATKADLNDNCGFTDGKGIIGRPPRLTFQSGPARGALIAFATYEAGARRVAGGQWDLIVCDEPGQREVFGELIPRLLRRRGYLRLGFTPTPDMPDQSWLVKRFEAKGGDRMERFTVGMAEAHMWPAGYPAPWLWQAEIDAYAATLLDDERAMRIEGSLEPVISKRWIRYYHDGQHVSHVRLTDLAKDRPRWALSVGIDHGTSDGKQCAMLVAVRGGDTERPEVVYLDETVNDGWTTPEHDAENIIAMLKRNGLVYDAVDIWCGDVPTASQKWDTRKSNRQLRKELARQLGRQTARMKEIREPNKYAGSPRVGGRMINTLFHRDAARVRPQCEWFRKSLRQFNGDPFHPLKDIWDAGRYATEAAITGAAQRALVARY